MTVPACRDPRNDRRTGMTTTTCCRAELFVDPSCPFAWITEQWLAEVERARPIELRVRLLSLAVVNEGRDIDAWYRAFNDAAWAPARVMAAVELEAGPAAARRFYEAYGQRFHVELNTADDADRLVTSTLALERAELPASLASAATDTQLDDVLRNWTRSALDQVGLDVGVPITVIDGVAASGPVFSRTPRGPEAMQLFDAFEVFARHRTFVRLERQRLEPLDLG
jgi:hypothetical protein